DEATIAQNGDEADIFGIELGFAQAFTGMLDGFVVQANYTFTDAEGTVTTLASEGPRDIALPATAKHTANFSVGYDKGPFDIRLSGTYRDKYLDELSDTADLDRYVDDHFQLDLSAKYRVNDTVQVFYEWVNINNAKYFAYNRLGGSRNLYQYEEYNWTMKAGVRVNF
ncbi:MAG: TonB-dependent receptor, partial [Pseudomonadota bacterium]|nr:TonB-dependent receptor [Pseudomonadota bacterium]